MKWSNLSWSLTKQGVRVRTREKLFLHEFLKVFIDDSTVRLAQTITLHDGLGLARSFDQFIVLPVSVELPRARFDDLELYIHYRFVPFASAPCCKIRPIYQGWRCCWFCRRMGNPAPESWLKWNARKDKKWIELWSWRYIRLLFPDVTWAALTFSGLWHSYSSYSNHFHIYSNVVLWGTGSRSQQIVINHPGHH